MTEKEQIQALQEEKARLQAAIEAAVKALDYAVNNKDCDPEILYAHGVLKFAQTAPVFKVGDKVRAKLDIAGENYPSGKYDIVHYVRVDGEMQLQFHEDNGISDCVYSPDDLEHYTESETA